MMFELKNGKSAELRTSCLADAKMMLDFLKQCYSESDYLTSYPDEIRISIEQEEQWLAHFDHVKAECFVIVSENKVIGNVSINPLGFKDKIKHRASLGITVLKDYWHQGLGKKLMEAAISFACQANFSQIELEVCTENIKAIALYEKHGFFKYGTRPNAFILRNGRALSEDLMVKILK